jgi:hypothetical protein
VRTAQDRLALPSLLLSVASSLRYIFTR